MDRLIFTAGSAMRAAMLRQTTLANNIANAATTGFRADLSVAQARWLDGPGLDARAAPDEAQRAADLSPGTISATGRDLDIAMEGRALLTVQAENGEEAYSRRGDLEVSDTGLLVTGDGHPVLGEGGPISIPPADSIRIAADGGVWIVPAGGDAATPQQAGRIKLATPTGSDIVKGTDNLLRVRGGGILPADPDARLASGHLEASNVSPTDALVAMIDASRGWDTQLRLLGAARDMDSAATGLMRLPN